MRKILTLVALFFASMATYAQASLGEGNLQFNAGTGLSGAGIPVYIGVDYGVTQDITVGGEFSMRTYTESYGSIKVRHTGYGFMAIGNYHFNRVLNIPSEIDLYAGFSLGYYNWTQSIDTQYNGDTASGPAFTGQIGGRYFFSDKFGLNIELGGGNVFGGKLGITYKF